MTDPILALAGAFGADPATPLDDDLSDLPHDLARLLSLVGGRARGNLRFATRAELDQDRACLCRRVMRFEAGESAAPADALWNAEWIPFASTSSGAIYAYDPSGCFRGRAGQIVSFDPAAGDSWLVFRSLALWVGALIESLACAGDDLARAAHDWARLRGMLGEVALPETRDAAWAKTRFGTIPGRPRRVDDQFRFTDFTLFILHAMSHGVEPAVALRQIAEALDAALPYCELRELASAALDDAEHLARSWLVPHLTKHARTKGVTALVFATHFRDGFQLWVRTGPSVKEPFPTDPTSSYTPCFERLGELIVASAVGFHESTWTFVNATAAFLVGALIDRAASELPGDAALEVHGPAFVLGRCDRDGFVPMPLTIARGQLSARRLASRNGLERMEFPGLPPEYVDHPVPEASSDTRTLRHADGRAWELAVVRGKLQCTMIDANGERETFARPVKTGWELETLVAAQLRAGFHDA